MQAFRTLVLIALRAQVGCIVMCAMDRLLAVDDHALGYKDLWIEPSHTLEAYEPVVVDVFDHHSDLVSVCG